MKEYWLIINQKHRKLVKRIKVQAIDQTHAMPLIRTWVKENYNSNNFEIIL